MWRFSPSFETVTDVFILPRPVTTLKVVDRWDSTRFSVPLRDGDRVHGVSRGGVDVSIRGRLSSHDGELTADELGMFDLLESMREAVRTTTGDTKLGLTLFTDGATRRGFRDCVILKMEYDLSEATLFAYSILVHASDPQLYTAGSLVNA